MMTAENPHAARAARERYLDWVAQRVRAEDFWMRVREHIIQDFADLLNRDLPEDLWGAAYSQHDSRDYLIALEAVLGRLQEYCRRMGKRG